MEVKEVKEVKDDSFAACGTIVENFDCSALPLGSSKNFDNFDNFVNFDNFDNYKKEYCLT